MLQLSLMVQHKKYLVVRKSNLCAHLHQNYAKLLLKHSWCKPAQLWTSFHGGES